MVREADPAVTARDAMRSLVFLEDQLARVVTGARPSRALGSRAAPPPARRTDAAFVEVAARRRRVRCWRTSGFALAGRHRTKPVTWWRNGDANVVVNETPRPAGSADQSSALGVVAPPVGAVAARAKALLWPAVDRTRGDGRGPAAGHHLPVRAARLRQRRTGRGRRLAA